MITEKQPASLAGRRCAFRHYVAAVVDWRMRAVIIAVLGPPESHRYSGNALRWDLRRGEGWHSEQPATAKRESMSIIEAGIPSREYPSLACSGETMGAASCVLSEHPSPHRSDLGLDFSAKLRLQTHMPPIRLDSRGQAQAILQSCKVGSKTLSNPKAIKRL